MPRTIRSTRIFSCTISRKYDMMNELIFIDSQTWFETKGYKWLDHMRYQMTLREPPRTCNLSKYIEEQLVGDVFPIWTICRVMFWRNRHQGSRNLLGRIWPSIIVVSGLVITRRNSISYGNERICSTGKHGLSFNPINMNEANKKTTAKGQQVQVVFVTHGFINMVGNISIVGIHSFQSPLQNVWISRLLVVAVPIGCLFTRDFRVNSPQ